MKTSRRNANALRALGQGHRVGVITSITSPAFRVSLIQHDNRPFSTRFTAMRSSPLSGAVQIE